MPNYPRMLAGLALLGASWPGLSRADAAPGVPLGPSYPVAEVRPHDEPGRLPACSFRYPVCVHADARIAPSTVLATLADLEHAAAMLGSLGMPRPLNDGRLGGNPAFDLYLVGPRVLDPNSGGETTTRDDPQPGPFDVASAFARLREDAPAGCVRKNLVARALAAASQWGLDAAEDPAVRDSAAAYLADLVAPCGQTLAELMDDFQAHPERGLQSSDPAAGTALAVALPWYLDLTLGAGSPGRVPIALAAIGGQRSDTNSWQWNNEPDLLDVLRSSLKARTPPTPLDDLWLDFATARLFMGDRDDGTHFAESAFLGSFGRVRFDWSIPYGSLPRRVSPSRPIDPTGATYLWIDLAGAPPHARLALRMEWEPPVLFRWALVRIKPDGSEDARLLVTPQQRSTSAEKNLEDLDGLAGVAVIGVNVGDLRLDEPFDPDEKPYEPHSYVLTVAVP